MNKRSIRRGVAAGLLVASGGFAASSCEVIAHETNNPLLNSVDRMATRFNLSAKGILGLMGCESHYNPTASNGHYKGLLQQGEQYWTGRLATYRLHNPDAPVSSSIYDTDANLMVSGQMMTGGLPAIRSNWQCESQSHCYTNPEGKKCLPETWNKMLQNAGAMAIGSHIVTFVPKDPNQQASVDRQVNDFMNAYAPDLVTA